MNVRKISSKLYLIIAVLLLLPLSLCACASFFVPVPVSNNSENENTDTSLTDNVDDKGPLVITVKETPTPTKVPSDAETDNTISDCEEEIMQPDPTGNKKLTPEEIDNAFFEEPISDELFNKMYGKSFKEDCTLPREDLRYVHILHKTLTDETLEGELVCNKAIADDLIDIFRQLYDASYPIEKVRLIDEYDADDESSMADNNTSCFNYRLVSGTNKLSKHGAGMAVDINPLYNPYIHTINGQQLVEPANSSDYADRSGDYPYKITHEDLAYELFTSHGFTWGGDWKNSKDYQHFQK